VYNIYYCKSDQVHLWDNPWNIFEWTWNTCEWPWNIPNDPLTPDQDGLIHGPNKAPSGYESLNGNLRLVLLTRGFK